MLLVNELTAEKSKPEETTYDELERQYDDYHFSLGSEKVFELFSLFNVLEKGISPKTFSSIWVIILPSI